MSHYSILPWLTPEINTSAPSGKKWADTDSHWVWTSELAKYLPAKTPNSKYKLKHMENLLIMNFFQKLRGTNEMNRKSGPNKVDNRKRCLVLNKNQLTCMG